MCEYKLVIPDEGRVNQKELWKWLHTQLVQRFGGYHGVDGAGSEREGVEQEVKIVYFATDVAYKDVRAFAREVMGAFRQERIYLKTGIVAEVIT